MTDMERKVLVIPGPTAAGKTALGVAVALEGAPPEEDPPPEGFRVADGLDVAVAVGIAVGAGVAVAAVVGTFHARTALHHGVCAPCAAVVATCSGHYVNLAETYISPAVAAVRHSYQIALAGLGDGWYAVRHVVLVRRLEQILSRITGWRLRESGGCAGEANQKCCENH